MDGNTEQERAGDGQSAELLARYLPPHNVEAEQSVLGAMLLETAAVEKAAESLSSEDFYRETHQILFESILAINARNQPVDLITLQNELRTRDKLTSIGGIGYLTALFDAVPTAAHVEHYARIVEEKSMLRKLIDAAMQVIGMARSPEPDQDVGDLIDQAEKLIFTVAQRRMNQYFSPLSPLLVTVYDRAEELGQLKARVSGLETGFNQLDMWTAGLQKSDMIIVAARPSMGKTSLCLSIAQHVALRNKETVAIFSLEMSKEQLALRMLCSEARVSSHRVRTGHLSDVEWGSLAESVDKMFDAPIFIDDATETSSITMRAKCRRLAAEHGLGLVIVDYLQLMRSHRRTENRVQEIGEIARGLKSLARELQVPVVALSQLSRAVEQRDNKRPMLSDLRESGSIEAEADLVCFLYREDYYKQKEARDAGEFMDKPDVERVEPTELIIGKHRNGPTGTVKIGFMPDYAKFVDLDLQADTGD